MRSSSIARFLPSGPSALKRSMTFISRLCTNRVPPEAIRALPMACETSVRRLTAEILAAEAIDLVTQIVEAELFSVE